MAANKKVFVSLGKNIAEPASFAKFSECIVGYLSTNHDRLETLVSFDEVKTIEDSSYKYFVEASSSECKNPLKLAHPSFCPIKNLPSHQTEQMIKDAPSEHLPLAVSTIVESSDSHILLTRRAKTLRAFPGVWVSPGGYIDRGESAITAGLRELMEETGIHAETFQAVPLCFWESVFPPMLCYGIPKRHTLVLYVHVQLKLPSKELENFQIAQDELDMICWVPKNAVRKIVDDSLIDGNETLKVFTANATNSLIETSHKLSQMAQILPQQNISKERFDDVERVSTGTKFAMKTWLEKIVD